MKNTIYPFDLFIWTTDEGGKEAERTKCLSHPGILRNLLAGGDMELSAAIIGSGLQLCGITLFCSQSHVPGTLSVLAISATAILPVDSSVGSRAAVRSDPHRPPAVVPRAFVRRTRRVRRRSLTEDGSEDRFSGDGDGDDGPFGGGGQGGRGWGFGGNGDSGWEEPEQRRWFTSSADPAFDVVYEVLCWIALSNCAHFALKKLSCFLAEREKEMSIRGFAHLLLPESPNLGSIGLVFSSQSNLL
ncbi:hypothetical protein AXF42_Ash007776 [Apostasia shenzhenica]|uniref:Uncharacterized protein n=1 Tax=Apostasia shenzhenica TaxID=1088818 RepID=A0A2I0B5B2_9ASPA|nr:hypothetical protein AXF42_Ash007776 [Apostasia shenzhenica]